MKKMPMLILLIAVFLFSCPIFADELDEQIAALESQISELQNELGQLKAQKALSENATDTDEPYVISDQYFYVYDSYGDTVYCAYVEITNTGSEPLYISDVVFDLEDTDGHLLQTDDYISYEPNVIAQGEKAYAYSAYCDIENNVDLNNMQFVPHIKTKMATGEPHHYELSDVSVTPDGDHFEVTGRLHNDGQESVASYVTIIFFDANGKCIGIDASNVFGDEDDEVISFNFRADGFKGLFDVKSY